MTTVADPLDRALEAHPQVALRPEPFGALAYHYGNRRLVFLKHADVLALVQVLGDHATVRDALDACAIAPARWDGFLAALRSLESAEVVRERPAGLP